MPAGSSTAILLPADTALPATQTRALAAPSMARLTGPAWLVRNFVCAHSATMELALFRLSVFSASLSAAFGSRPSTKVAAAGVRRFYACPENGRAYSRQMIQTIEAIVDERGAVRLLEPVQLDRRHRALVTILTDEPSEAHETALLSEASLAKDWNRPEEDAAWSHLQQAP